MIYMNVFVDDNGKSYTTGGYSHWKTADIMGKWRAIEYGHRYMCRLKVKRKPIKLRIVA